MPCEGVDRVDRRYRARYGISFVGNLREIEERGVDAFLKDQEVKFVCPVCGDVVSVHDGKCYACVAKTANAGK
jgi:rubrerythrin